MLTFAQFQNSADWLTVDEAAERFGMFPEDFPETTVKVWTYEEDCWLCELADGSHWLLIEREEYTGAREDLERRLYVEFYYVECVSSGAHEVAAMNSVMVEFSKIASTYVPAYIASFVEGWTYNMKEAENRDAETRAGLHR